MKNKKVIATLAALIAVVSAISALWGIQPGQGSQTTIQSVRGQEVTLYGKGLYKDMSKDVAIQGIAQDWITLIFGIPALLISLYFSLKGSLKGRLVLAGTLGYFSITYLFYMAMAMYNQLFLAYVFLMGCSFFALAATLFSFNADGIWQTFKKNKNVRHAGYFLILNSVLISLLWLSIVIPPLLNGTIVPVQAEHYTTLIVQGFDLGLLLPFAFVSGLLAVRKNAYGFLFTITNLVLLSLLMTALVSKIIFMANAGQNVIPVIFIIPAIDLASIIFSFLALRKA